MFPIQLILLCFLICFSSSSGTEIPLHESEPPAPPNTQEQNQKDELIVLSYGDVSFKTEDGITPELFRRHMFRVKNHGFHIATLQEAIAWLKDGRPLPGKSVLIVLNEPTAAVAEHFLPILQDLHMPCVIFIDADNLNERPRRMNRQTLKQAVARGATIGSLGMQRIGAAQWQYAAMAGKKIYHAQAQAELGDAAAQITDLFGRCLAFSYSNDSIGSLPASVIAEYGYQAAFCPREGKITSNSPLMSLPRYDIADDSTFARAISSSPESPLAERTSTSDNPGNSESALPDKGIPPLPHPPAPLHAPARPAESHPSGYSPESPPVLENRGESSRESAENAEHPRLSETLKNFLDDDDFAEELEPGQEGKATPKDSFSSSEERAKEVSPAEPEKAEAADVNHNQLATNDSGEWVTRQFANPLVPREQTRVAVLGYHNFSNTKAVSEMRMRTSEFCQQMQYIRNAKLSVITMQDLLDWQQGRRQLPERCILITIDDGWKSVWTDAFPILKAYGYPFTLYLYTEYINVHGDSMTTAWIQEMQRHGATIGSHSTSHLYPRAWKKAASDAPRYAAQIQEQINDSCSALKTLFGHCNTYCYPGGYHTPPMLEAIRRDYQAAFTVVEGKLTIQSDPLLLNRYMVFGNDPSIFRRAVNFDGAENKPRILQEIAEARVQAEQFFPQAFVGQATPSPHAGKTQVKRAAKHGDRKHKNGIPPLPRSPQSIDFPAPPPTSIPPAESTLSPRQQT